MKPVELIEGTAKSILERIHSLSAEDSLDDTEHIRNIRAVIEGAEAYIRSTRNYSQDSGRVKENLYQFARDLWLKHAEQIRKKFSEGEDAVQQDEGYAEYYYDHIYHEGNYPR
ncbi:MAG: hypothetical protein R2941_09590 [Desulfobacterales bacterium]